MSEKIVTVLFGVKHCTEVMYARFRVFLKAGRFTSSSWAKRKMPKCHNCSKEVKIKLPVGRKDVCPSCGADLRCCLNCVFYTPGAYNECREPQAERVLEKDRSNFCEYFGFRGSVPGREDRDSARAKLESLFK
jgi:hypothetical protein